MSGWRYRVALEPPLSVHGLVPVMGIGSGNVIARAAAGPVDRILNG